MEYVDFRPEQDDLGIFVYSVYQPSLDRAPPRPRFSDPGFREYDEDLGCWVAVRQSVEDIKPVAPAAIPAGDGSKRFWRVVDRCGQLLWTLEAVDFDAALIEKRRLCRSVGGRSGWADMVEVTGTN